MRWSHTHLVLTLWAISCASVVLAGSLPSWSQSSAEASISGITLDSSGAVIAGASITARNLKTSFKLLTTSDDHGLFRFPVLSVGQYELTATHPGFATFQITYIELSVGANLSVTLRFKVAVTAEATTVTAEGSTVETGSQLSTTIDNRFISNLPANGRDFTTYALLTPGVTEDVRGGLSFGGQRAMNSLLLDGINNDDNFWGQPVGATGFVQDGRQPYYISEDAVQEFQVNSSSYSAEFGRAGGGVINTVTKSGTNDVHGSTFWYYRDKAMDANDLINKRFGLPKSPFHFNQFGATLGGPIRKDRLFFFGSYDGMRSNIPNPVFLNLPAAFQLDPDPVIRGFQEVALDYLRPRAKSWVWPVSQNDYLGKLDCQFSPRNRISGTAVFQRFVGGGALDSGPQDSFEHTNSNPVSVSTGSVSLTSIWSNRTVNVARLGFLRSYIAFGAMSARPEANIFEDDQLVLTVGRESSQRQTIHQTQWSDVLNHQIGRHSLKFGADVLTARINFFIEPNFFAGGYFFSSLASFGSSLAGQPQRLPDDGYIQAFSGFGTPGVMTHPDFTSTAVFMDDQWRLRPSFTLDLGIRYDLQAIVRPLVVNPSPELLNAGLNTSVLPTDKRNFSPRVGIAWSPLESQSIVLRAGYGIFYATTPSFLTSRADFQNGITVQTRTFSGGDPTTVFLIPQYPNNFCGPPEPAGILPSCAPPAQGGGPPTLQFFSVHYHQPYVQQGNLGVELLPRKDLSVLVSYVISKGTRLQQVRDVNLAGTSFSPITFVDRGSTVNYLTYDTQRPFQDFTRILVFNSDANSIYHGLVTRVNKRFTENFHALASYTFSKVLDDNPNVYALNAGEGNGNLVQYPTNPKLDRGPGNNDQRHRFTLAGVWDSRYADGLSGPLKGILDGWELSGTLTAASGQPYSGLLYADLNNDGDFATDRTPGLGRNTFQMPMSLSLSPRLTRTIAIGEWAKLQLMWEAFNVLNHSNIVGVNSNQYGVSHCGSAIPCLVPNNQGLNAFGSPQVSSGARILQLAVRITF
jgi:outer membrane receptor protein involved in Fe transport